MSARLRMMAGTVAVIGGVALIATDIGFFSGYLTLGADAEFAEVAASGWWIPVATLGLAAMVLILLALPGVYRQQAEKSGLFGMISAGLLFVFSVLAAGAMYVFAYVAPWLADQAPQLLTEEGPGGVLDAALAVTFIGFAVALALFGISTILARVYPRWIGAAMILSGILAAVPFVPAGSMAIGGAAFIGYGIVLRRLVADEPEITVHRELPVPHETPAEPAGT
jgi:hypothetical protein